MKCKNCGSLMEELFEMVHDENGEFVVTDETLWGFGCLECPIDLNRVQREYSK